MRGIIKYTISIYLGLFLFYIPAIAIQQKFPDIIKVNKAKIVISKLEPQNNKIIKLIQNISTKYKRDKKEIEQIVQVVHKYSHNTFPTTTDILAIIAIESSFNIHAISSANAKGLMQILYKKTSFNPDHNISDGVWLLKDYRRKLSLEGTIQAYNVGIGNYKKGMRNPTYLKKFNLAKAQLEKI